MKIRFYSTCISLCVIFLINGRVAGAMSGNASVGPLRASGSLASSFAHCVHAGLTSDTTLTGQAEALYQAGRYFEATIAWDRILFDSQDSTELLTAVLGKTQCLKQQKNYDQAYAFLETWLAYPFPDSGQVRIHSQQILCAYLGGHFENVLSQVDRWSYLHHGVPPDARVLVLKILALNELRRWSEAAADYHQLIAGFHSDTALTDYYAHLPKQKSEAKAEKLSTFIPGAGQFYAGSPFDGLFSICIQAAGIYFGVLSFEQHYYLSAWLIGAALFGAFHMGGVHRAVVLVQHYNRRQMLAFNEKVRVQLLTLISARKGAQ